jgi:SRSO17 transposase
VIDDAALPKKGALSVGVARQCCGQPGKKANSLMFVVNLFGRDRAASAEGAELTGV